MKKIANVAAYLFIVAVILLSIISIFGVWDILAKDVITKSFQSISLLAAVAVITLIAERFVDSRKNLTATADQNFNVSSDGIALPVETNANSGFTIIRHITLAILITSVVLLALLGILSIWEVLSGTVVTKSISSIAIVAFSSFVIVFTCLHRENHKILNKGGKSFSIGNVVGFLIIAWIFSSLFGIFFH